MMVPTDFRVRCLPQWLILVILLAPSAALALDTAALRGAADGRLAHIFDRGRLIVGVKTDYPPWGMFDDRGDIIGLEPDLARRLGRRIGLPVELVPVTTSDRLQRLQQGEIDVVIATLGDTPARQATADLLRPHYYASGVRLLALEDQPFTRWDELRGRSVCLTDGAYFNKQLIQRYLIEPLIFSGTRDNLLALKDGRCVGWAYDDMALAQTQRKQQLDQYRVSLPPIFESRWSVAVRRGEGQRTLGRFISATLIEWHRSGLLQESLQRWGVPQSDFLAQQRAHWRETAQASCRADESGLMPKSCIDPVSRTTGSNLAEPPPWVARLREITGLDLAALFDSYSRARLLTGLWLTLALSLVAIVGSLLFGIVAAVGGHLGRQGVRRLWLGLPIRGFLAVARMTPPILQLYILYFGLSELLSRYIGLSLNSFVVAGIVFSVYAGASNAAVLMPGLARQSRLSPDSSLAVCAVRAVEQNFEALISIMANVVKAASLASVIALPDIISAVTGAIGQGGDATSLMTLLVLFYFSFVLVIMSLLKHLKRWVAP